MNDLSKKSKTSEENLDIKATDAENSQTEETKKDEATEIVNEVEELQKKYDELEDKYLRLAAEYTNFQRRTKEEKEAIYTSSVCDAVTQLLPIMDNLERAVAAANEASDVKTVADGVEMVMKMTLEAFSKLGVEPIEALGKEFDATYHNAVMHIDDEAFGKNEVCEEFQKGYKCKDKVIRYSMVKVAN